MSLRFASVEAVTPTAERRYENEMVTVTSRRDLYKPEMQELTPEGHISHKLGQN